LARVIESWHLKLGVSNLRTFVRGLRQFVGRHGGLCPSGLDFSWASGCSGTDIMFKALGALSNYWQSAFGLQVGFPCAFKCEADPRKREFLRSQFDAKIIFEKVEDLLNQRAVNTIDGSCQFVPYSRGFASGFSCTSRSSASVHASRNVNCVQRGTEATGLTYRACADYVFRSGQEIAILENVAKLEEKGDGDLSDAEYIVMDFTQHDYACVPIKFDAACYGSWPHRLRLYFVAIKGNTELNRARLRQMQAWLSCMAIGPGAAEDVIMTESELEAWYGTRGSPPAKRTRQDDTLKDRAFKMEHMEIFAAAGVTWPPTFSKYDGAIDYRGMSNRMKECAYFYHEAFPTQADELGDWVAVNLNESLGRTMGYPAQAEGRLKNPWVRPQLGTLTGSSRWCVRRQQTATSVPQIRLLTGVEAMRCIGWDLSFWAQLGHANLPAAVDDDLLTNMAGNAFSAYRFCPVAACVMAAFGFGSGDFAMAPAVLDRMEPDARQNPDSSSDLSDSD